MMRRNIVEGGRIDTAVPDDRDGVVGQRRSGNLARPPPHQHAHRGPGARQRYEGDVPAPFGQDQFGHGPHRPGKSDGTVLQDLLEQLAVLGVRLILDRQGFGVVGVTRLDTPFPLGHVRLEVHVGEVFEEPRHLFGGVRPECGSGQRAGSGRARHDDAPSRAARSRAGSAPDTTASTTSVPDAVSTSSRPPSEVSRSVSAG
jgi:hypothetical protein